MAFAAAALLGALASPAFAYRERSHYSADSDHPLRISHYFVYPIGKVLEWAVTRPMAEMGAYIAPHHHINHQGFKGCSRERPARSCTYVIK